MNIHTIYAFAFRAGRFRKRRMQRFERIMSLADSTTILDVGGSLLNWQQVSVRPRLTLLNRDGVHDRSDYPENVRFQVGDALNVPFPDNAFDIVFSNSVIEHVSTWENQRRFADEARRVGRRVWVQTPAREFFLEPHLMTPLVHWLPAAWRRRLLRRFTLWGWLARPTPCEAEAFVRETRLIGLQEMQTLFPDCRIYVERWLGMPKSYVAYRL